MLLVFYYYLYCVILTDICKTSSQDDTIFIFLRNRKGITPDQTCLSQNKVTALMTNDVLKTMAKQRINHTKLQIKAKHRQRKLLGVRIVEKFL